MPSSANTDSISKYVGKERSTFDELPLSRVDSLVLTQLAYFKWDRLEGVPTGFDRDKAPHLRNVCTLDHFPMMVDHGRSKEEKIALLANLTTSPRWRDLKILNHSDIFDEDSSKQFSATTFILPDESIFVSYRGTDSTIVGWKEDFMLAFVDETPSQQEARRYLDRIAKCTEGPIFVGGHSKGGNLAVYATATCSQYARDRVKRTFSHDGPGFSEETLKKANILALAPKLDKIVPQDSTVGMLLNSAAAYKVVRSTAFGFDQHDAYSWVVTNGDFEYLDGLSDLSLYFSTTMSKWLGQLSKEQMKIFTDTLFGIFGAGGEKTVEGDLSPKNILAQADYLGQINPEMRSEFFNVVGLALRTSFNTIDPIGAISDFVDTELSNKPILLPAIESMPLLQQSEEHPSEPQSQE